MLSLIIYTVVIGNDSIGQQLHSIMTVYRLIKLIHNKHSSITVSTHYTCF